MNAAAKFLLIASSVACVACGAFYAGAKMQADGLIDVNEGVVTHVIEKKGAYTVPEDDYVRVIAPTSYLSGGSYLGQTYYAADVSSISFDYQGSYYAMFPYAVHFRGGTSVITGVTFVNMSLSSVSYTGGVDLSSDWSQYAPYMALASSGSATSKLFVLGGWYGSLTLGSALLNAHGNVYHDLGYWGNEVWVAERNPAPADPVYTISVDYSVYLEYLDTYMGGFLAGYASGADNETGAAYQNGVRDGEDAGYRDGYWKGYNEGVGANDPAHVATLGDLFAAVVGVPIGVIDGLSPLVIWNTPIINLIITFLFIGVLIALIKKFLAR